jgi:uncharacterized protein with HEPN domain
MPRIAFTERRIYETLKMEYVWQTAEKDIPTFLDNLLEIQETDV